MRRHFVHSEGSAIVYGAKPGDYAGYQEVELDRNDVAFRLERGWSYVRIARLYSVSNSSLRNWCLKHGLKSKHKPIVRRKKKSIA